MSAAATLLVLATMGLAGVHVVARLWGRPLGLARVLPRALLLGPPAVALLVLVCVLARVPLSLPVLLAPFWVAAALDRRRLAAALAGGAPLPAAARVLQALALVLFAGALYQGLQLPVHRADPIHMYGFLGRIVETTGAFRLDVLERLVSDEGPFAHPPLLGLQESVVFLAAGEARALAVKPLFALTWLAWLLLVIEVAFGALRPRLAAPLALVFLFVPGLAANAVRGQADLALTATLLLLAVEARVWLGGEGRSAWPWLACALVVAGLKSEGVALVTAAVPLLLLLGWRRDGRLARVLLGGVVLALAWAWLVWKRAHGLEAQHIDAGGAGLAANLGPVLAGLARAAVLPRPIGTEVVAVHAPLALVLAASTLAFGGAAGLRRVGPWLGLAALHLLVYATVVAGLGDDAEWQLAVAGDRLLLHLTPWLLLLAVAAAGPSDEVRPAQPSPA